MDEVKGHVQIITLNNPSKLNIISREVVSRLADVYEKWEKENDAEIMIIKGAGRAFCAGGNLRALYYGKAGKHTIEFFYKTYWLQYHIHTYNKTLVAFVNGLAMGAGASLAMPSTFRIVTEKTVLAAPEVAFGFHTESGLSYILSHLSGHLGEYLALTGSRLDGVEMIATGIATHYIPSEKLEELERRLVDLNTGDRNIVRAAIEEFSLQVNLGKKSILHGFDKARKQTRFECLKKEFRLTINTLRGLISNDTYEGIRALIIEKDNSPKWNPPSLSDVTEDRLNLLFQPLEEEFELQLPTEGNYQGKYGNSDFDVKYPRNYDYGVGMHKEMFKCKSQL